MQTGKNVLGRVHTKLTKHNRNKSETHIRQKQTFSRRFSVLSCPQSADSWSEVNTWSVVSRKIKKMRTYAWLRLALYSSHQKYKKRDVFGWCQH
jgi:hypothetical protein